MKTWYLPLRLGAPLCWWEAAYTNVPVVGDNSYPKHPVSAA